MLVCFTFAYEWASLITQLVKNPPAMQKTPDQFLGWEDPLEKRKTTHSGILAWRMPWTMLSMESQRDRHDLATEHTPHLIILVLSFLIQLFKVIDFPQLL